MDTKNKVALDTTNAKVEEEISKDIDQKAEEIFATYKSSEILYKTSDGLYFLEKCNAMNHSASLESKDIKEITRQ